MDQNMSLFLVPWGMALGCGLVAASGLSFFGIGFLKTKLEATAAFLAGVLVIWVVEIFMVADSGAYFFQSQKQHVAQCYLESERAYPTERATKDNEAGRYVTQCLTRLGYDWSPENEKCQALLIPINAFCYLPSGMVGRAVTRFQMMFEQP